MAYTGLRSPLGDWGWLEACLVSGEALEPGNAQRSTIFHWVRADRDGPLTRPLLAFTTDERVAVRRTVFELLHSLSLFRPAWPAVADAAEPALADPDPQVRRAAATVLAITAEPERAVAALDAATDPITRTALVDALTQPFGTAVAGRLRSDPLPAVRLLATVATFGKDDPAAWPALDLAVRADLEACVGLLDAPGSPLLLTGGERWARVLTHLDREQDCYAWAERLTHPAESTPVRLEGIRLAAAALRTWRAAPARLADLLWEAAFPGEVRAAALRAITSSVTATRITAHRLVPLLDDPEIAVALGRAGDQRAMPRLMDLLLAGSDDPALLLAFRTLAPAADPEPPVAAARQVLVARPGPSEPCLALRVLELFGPAAAAAVPEIIAVMAATENDTPDYCFRALGRIGPAAAAAVPILRQYPTRGGTLALLKITGDRTVADGYLAALPEQLGRPGYNPEFLAWLAEHGGLTDRQHRQLRSLFDRPGAGQLESAYALWLHEGPAAAAELLEILPDYLTDDLYGPKALRVLVAMGPHARPILDRLDSFIAARRRAGFSIGDADREMRADETLLEATIAARALLLTAGCR